jgi:L-threonylcarbamoyladenylate synthase
MEVIVVDPEHPDAAAIWRAAECLRDGGLVAFPTETVYGLGVNALDARAVTRLFAAKGRPSNDPLIVHVASVEQAAQVSAALPPAAEMLAVRFWPGPLTLVLPKAADVPVEVTAGLPTVGVRVPAHPVARALLEAAAIPVAAPSANLFSRPSPTRAAHVIDDLDGRIDLVLDGGATPVGVESTVLDLTGAVPIVLRPGAITLEQLRELLPRADVRPGAASGVQGAALPSPGLLAKHYSPRTPLTLYEGEGKAVLRQLVTDARAHVTAGRTVAVLAADEDRADLADLAGVRVLFVGKADALPEVAARLYAALRELDATGADVILARGFPAGSGLGLAIGDRLRRAAAGRILYLSGG